MIQWRQSTVMTLKSSCDLRNATSTCRHGAQESLREQGRKGRYPQDKVVPPFPGRRGPGGPSRRQKKSLSSTGTSPSAQAASLPRSSCRPVQHARHPPVFGYIAGNRRPRYDIGSSWRKYTGRQRISHSPSEESLWIGISGGPIN